MNFSEDNIFLGHLSPDQCPNMAIFLSGSGSNAERLLTSPEVLAAAKPVVLVTDAPEKSRASLIAEKFGLPLVALSIREFYRQHGLTSISLATAEGREVRELWTEELRRQLRDFKIDFGVLAGFEPLSNITRDFPCLNVHPGDLSAVDAAGRRCYVGLHSRPIESAVLAGEKSLRASVIIAGDFTNADKDMDNGILLGISQAMPLQLPIALEELQKIRNARQGRKPAGGWQDELEKLAFQLQEQLKIWGDHMILPLIVRDFARRCFAWDNNTLYYRSSPDQAFQVAETLEYDQDGKRKK